MGFFTYIIYTVYSMLAFKNPYTEFFSALLPVLSTNSNVSQASILQSGV